MNNPQETYHAKTYEVQLSPDATFQDLITVINSLHIRFSCLPDDESYTEIKKHSREVGI